MRVTYRLTDKDVFEAQSEHAGLWIKLLPLFGLLVLFASSASLVHDPKQFGSLLPGFVVGLLLTFVRRIQAWFSFRGDTRLEDQFEAVISDSGIDVSSSKANSQYGWNAFVRYVETKNLFLVYQAPKVFNVFPKRAFAAEDVATFRNLLAVKLGAGSILYRKTISPRAWILLILITISAIMLVMAILNIR